MVTRKRSRTRIVFTLAAVLLVFAGVELAHWSLRPLGDSPAIEFPAVSISQAEVEHFLDGDFQVIRDTKALPKPVIDAFTETGGSRLTVANPGKRFQATDLVLDPSLPGKRLIFAGLAGNKCFMLYEQGGIELYYVLALFKLSPPNVLTPISQGSCQPAADIAELRASVSLNLCPHRMPFHWVPHVTDH